MHGVAEGRVAAFAREAMKTEAMAMAEDNTARPATTETGMGHRLTQIDTDRGKSSRRCAILRDCSARRERSFVFIVLNVSG
jgi:hypothetical protein